MKKGLARFLAAAKTALSGIAGVIFLTFMCQDVIAGHRRWVAKDFVLAVHAGEEKSGTYPRSYLERLADEMHQRLKARSGFRLVERAELKKNIKSCLAGRTDARIRQKCRTLVGSEAGAQKGFVINIEKRRGLVCRLNIVLFDQMSGANNRWYGGISACEFDDFMRIVDSAVDKVASERSDTYAADRAVKTDGEIEIYLVQMLEGDKKYTEAMQHLRLAEEMDPSWKLPLVMQAELAERVGNLELCRSKYKRLLEITKNDPVFKKLVRRALLKTGLGAKDVYAKRSKVDFWVVPEVPVQAYSMDVSAADDGSVLVVGKVEKGEKIGPAWVERLGAVGGASRQIVVIKFRKGGEVDWVDHSARAPGGKKYSYISSRVAETLPGGASLIGGGFDGSVTLGLGKRSKTNLSTDADFSAFLARYNRQGKIEWVWRSNNTGFAMVMAAAGLPDQSSVIAGRFKGELSIAGKKYRSMKDWTEVFVARIDKDGSPVWATVIPHDGEWSYSTLTRPVAIDVYEDGSSVLMATLEKDVVVGSTRGKRTRRLYLFRLDPDGKQTWSKSYETEWIEGGDVATLPDGSLLLSGNLHRALELKEAGTIIPEKYSDAFVVRIDSSGNAIWGYRLGGAYYDSGLGIGSSTDGTFAWLGRFEGSVTTGGPEVKEMLLENRKGLDTFIQGFNRDGKPKWLCHGNAIDETMNYLDLDVSPNANIAVLGNSLSNSTYIDCGHGLSKVAKGKGVFVVGIIPIKE